MNNFWVKLSQICILGVFFINSIDSSDLDDHITWKYLPKECGNSVASDRIVGGSEASLGQYPWLARLGYFDPGVPYNFYSCAGALVNRWFVLTAKHCFDPRLGTIVSVRLGENFLNKDIDCENGICAPPVQDFSIAKAIKYPEKDLFYGDLALIKLDKPAILSDFVSPICLPKNKMLSNPPKYLKIGTVFETAGWGTTVARRTVVPDKLVKVKLPVVEHAKCAALYTRRRIDHTTICIGNGTNKDTCSGDSGAPVVKPVSLHGPPRYYIFGLVSFGLNSCGMGAGVYTNITHYMKWILDSIEPVL